MDPPTLDACGMGFAMDQGPFAYIDSLRIFLNTFATGFPQPNRDLRG